jgi:tripartite-type tricarboxylate transporter receptor subunit TctC
MSGFISRRHLMGGLAVASALPGLLWAQTAWPTRPVKVVVPYPAGGSPDLFARVVARELGNIYSQPFNIDNKPGAAALIGARAVSQNPNEIHALAYITSGHVTVQAMDPSFNLLTEFKLISRMSNSPYVCVVNAKSPYKTMADLVAAAKANPGKLTYGSAGIGSPAHMAVEYLEEKLPAFKALHIPYKGAVESANAILGGQIDFSIMVLGTAVPHLKGGQLRALAVTTNKSVQPIPEVPTISDTVAPGYSFGAWGGFAMPTGTPDDVIARMHKALMTVSTSAALIEETKRTGSIISMSESPKEFAEQIARDVATEMVIVKKLGLR